MSSRVDHSSTFLSQSRSRVPQLRAFALQLTTLGFWLTGPHGWRESLCWALPVMGLFLLGKLPTPERTRPNTQRAGNALRLYALSGIQAVNYIVMLFTASLLGFDTLDAMAQTGAMLVPTIALAGLTAGYFAVSAGRELAHSQHVIEQTIGRLLLLGVLCDHAVGSAAVGMAGPRLQQQRPLDWRSLAVTAMVIGTLGYACGTVAVIFFLVQAATAKLLLETHSTSNAVALIGASREVERLDADDELYSTQAACHGGISPAAARRGA